jgi:acyl-CoA thioesterase-1
MSIPFKQNDLILFIGDSITDCERNRADSASLGCGYAKIIADRLRADYSELNLRYLNRGISGDRTCDLLARWEGDCTDLKPEWVSILVGVNNTWRRYDQNNPTSDEVFEIECRELLQRVKDQTVARIVLCSPFLLHTTPAVAAMREDLDPKIETIKKLAGEFDAIGVDFDAAFIAAQNRHTPSYWADDGVHPSDEGHALMADTWLASIEG